MMWSWELPHGKSEKVYKKICDAMNKADLVDQCSSFSDDKMDYSVLYAAVKITIYNIVASIKC
jgi:hypothetical protein